MTATKHTPGPWKARRDDCHFGSLSEIVGGERGPKMGLEYELMVEVGGFGAGSQEANTRLIAASPTMLEALKNLVNACKNGWIAPDAQNARPDANLLGYEAGFNDACTFYAESSMVKQAEEVIRLAEEGR